MIDTKKEMLNDLNTSFTKGQIYSHSELRSFLESNKLFSVKNVAAIKSGLNIILEMVMAMTFTIKFH